MALRWAGNAPARLLHGLGAEPSPAVTTCALLLRSELAASFSRCAELMRFMDCSTSAGKSMEVMSVLTTS